MNDKNNRKQLMSNLARQRSNQGISQSQMADMLRISQSYVSDIESGNRRITLELYVMWRDKLSLNNNFLND